MVSALWKSAQSRRKHSPATPSRGFTVCRKIWRLINRLGFNNEGAEAIAIKLDRLRARGGRPKIPLGMNIGRTKIVETKDAVADFLACFEKLFPHGDFFTLNVSSPNTPNLRDLQEKSLVARSAFGGPRKKSPTGDRAPKSSRSRFCKNCAGHGVCPSRSKSSTSSESTQLTGIVATNATAFMREDLKSPNGPEPGGLSGRPITAMVTPFIAHIYQITRGRLPIIGVGGIFDAQDAYDKIKAGANAVQIYTGWIYEGPGAVKRINQGLAGLLKRDGLKHISQAVGVGAKS